MNKLIKSILTEVYDYYTKPLLTEAALAQDVYNKCYSDKMPLDEFMYCVNLDPTSKDTPEGKTKGAFVPWIVEHFTPMYKDAYKAKIFKNALTAFITIRNSAKDLIPDGFRTNIDQYESFPDLVKSVTLAKIDYAHNIVSRRGTEPINGFPNMKVIPDLCDVVYKDDTWTVLVPKNREGAIYYGAHTHWCTAVSGNNASKDWYQHYLDEYGGEYYICFNSKTHERYQFHFESNNGEGMFCDENDNQIYHWEEIEGGEELEQIFQELKGENDANKLSNNRITFNFEGFQEWLSDYWDGFPSTFRDTDWYENENSPVDMIEFDDCDYLLFHYDGLDEDAYLLTHTDAYNFLQIEDDKVLYIPQQDYNEEGYMLVKERFTYEVVCFNSHEVEWCTNNEFDYFKILDADLNNRLLTLQVGDINEYYITIDADALGYWDVLNFLAKQHDDIFGINGTEDDSNNSDRFFFYNLEDLNIYTCDYMAVIQTLMKVTNRPDYNMDDDSILFDTDRAIVKQAILQNSQQCGTIKDKVKYYKFK